MIKTRPALKAIFNAANINGAGAALMSVDLGVGPATAVYLGAVVIGTYNKYAALTRAGAPPGNPLLRLLSRPAITTWAFMGAALGNLAVSAWDLATQGPQNVSFNLLRMGGWMAGFLGDNAMRRIDAKNFRPDAEALGSRLQSNLSKTFNELVSNPTLFYGLTSTGFVLAELSHRFNDAGRRLPMFSGPDGIAGAATAALVGTGILYAARNSWRAARGEIPRQKINDGVMNGMAGAAKLSYTFLAASAGCYGLAAAHALFSISTLKTLYETRAALKAGKAPG